MIKLTFSREEWTILAKLLDAEALAQRETYARNKPALERNLPYIESLEDMHSQIDMALQGGEDEGGAK